MIAHDRIVRVYSRTTGRFRTNFEACVVGGAIRMTLISAGHSEGPGSRLGQVVFAGTLLAYLSSSFGIDTSGTSLTVVDVATRRVLREISVGHRSPVAYEEVTKLVLAPDGAVAWISAVEPPGRRTPSYVVHAVARTGPPSVLDEGTDIGGTSLSLSGHTLSWWHGGVERTAPLP